jgi:hypothetical protein
MYPLNDFGGGGGADTPELLLFISLGWDCVSELQSQTRLLFISKIYECGATVNDTDHMK